MPRFLVVWLEEQRRCLAKPHLCKVKTLTAGSLHWSAVFIGFLDAVQQLIGHAAQERFDIGIGHENLQVLV